MTVVILSIDLYKNTIEVFKDQTMDYQFNRSQQHQALSSSYIFYIIILLSSKLNIIV
jgi:hypothetical protein